ncbi:hypothetical protein KFL18_004953 [Salmonella enterica]|nr:hypothetical protein [Salmonella enterica]EIB2596382.1 hypothetical protein [Salmonella enterica]EIB2615301.1 hypothetical protein [Salmonella enterica]EIB2624214.1 hypothetical protein [Salmonella enterica]EIB2642590.1 hypothetical protein [Salmonella enterica]
MLVILGESAKTVLLAPEDFEAGDTLKPEAQKAVDSAALVIYQNRVIKNTFGEQKNQRTYSWLDREFVRGLQPMLQDIVKDRIARGCTTEEATTFAQQAVKAVTSALSCIS